MLLEMLKESPQFKEHTVDKQEMYALLATLFEETQEAIYLTPKELTKKLGRGNQEIWTNFLSLEAVRNYIRSEMVHLTSVAQRKALLALQKQAIDGNVQAAKEINELSGIMQSADHNKIIILHQIQRPVIQNKLQQSQGNSSVI